MRAKKQCANINCNVRVIAKTYCDIHSNNFSTSSNQSIGDKLRQYIRQRDSNICYVCGGYGNIVDHIIPKVLNGSDDPINLACICKSCHNAKTARDGRM